MPAELVDFRETGSVRRDPCGPARRRSGDDIAARVPLTILNGLPRRGQDTLLNRILNGDNGLRVAVIVNDFGSINIDAELVVGVESDVISSRERLRAERPGRPSSRWSGQHSLLDLLDLGLTHRAAVEQLLGVHD